MVAIKSSAPEGVAKCPLWVKKQTCVVQEPMSALPEKADTQGQSPFDAGSKTASGVEVHRFERRFILHIAYIDNHGADS